MKTRTVAFALALWFVGGCSLFGPDDDFGSITVSGTVYADSVPLQSGLVSDLTAEFEFTESATENALTSLGYERRRVSSPMYSVTVPIPDANCGYVSLIVNSPRSLVESPWGPFPGRPSDSSAGYWLPCTADTAYVGLDFYLVGDTLCWDAAYAVEVTCPAFP